MYVVLLVEPAKAMSAGGSMTLRGLFPTLKGTFSYTNKQPQIGRVDKRPIL